MAILDSQQDFLSIPSLVQSVTLQVEGAGWGLQTSKLKGLLRVNPPFLSIGDGLLGLPQPALGVLIIAKHLAYAGKEAFNFVQVEEEYLRFSRTKLVGSGKTRWPIGVLRSVSTVFGTTLKSASGF